MNIKCRICKKHFYIPRCRFKIAKYCSYRCYWKSKQGKIPTNPFKKGNIPWNKNSIKKTCKICHTIFTISPYRKNSAKFCSYKCYWINKKEKHNSIKTEYKKGKKNPNWKGGKVKSGGRIRILYPKHPFANILGYVSEPRLIAEKYLKRFLKSGEVVHHINEIKDDNRPENLYVFKNSSHHTSHHFSKNKHLKSNLLY